MFLRVKTTKENSVAYDKMQGKIILLGFHQKYVKDHPDLLGN